MYEQRNNGTNKYMNPFSHQPGQCASEIKGGFCPKYTDGAKGSKISPTRHASGVYKLLLGPKPCRKHGRAREYVRASPPIQKGSHPVYATLPISSAPAKLTLLRYLRESPNLCPYGTIFLRFPFCLFARNSGYEEKDYYK